MPAAGAAGAATALTTRNVALYGLVSSAAAVGVVVSAFRQRSNFYSAAVMLGGSNGCMLVLFNFGLFLTIVFGKACQRIFFGALRAIEIEHLYERSWYAVTESLLAMTMFRDEFDSSFVILFGTLLFLKVFHWLSADRIEFMEQSPSVSRLFHARMISILWTLFWLDTFLVAFAVEILIIDQKKVGIMIMFASEVSAWSRTLKSYLATDLSLQPQCPVYDSLGNTQLDDSQIPDQLLRSPIRGTMGGQEHVCLLRRSRHRYVYEAPRESKRVKH